MQYLQNSLEQRFESEFRGTMAFNELHFVFQAVTVAI